MATESLARPTQQPTERRLPGDFNVWVFVLGDMVFFAAYFIIFMVVRHRDGDLFLQAQRHLSLTAGVINTLLLLASSRFVALGVASSRAGEVSRAVRRICYGGLCGVLFLAVKVYEWHHEISQGYTLAHNDFFMFYFMLTGVHLLHVVFGLGVLGIVIREIRNPSRRRSWVAEAGATYWHMVDLLWVILFALLYVMR
jgi:nitric oxide reductase NorE protein